MSRIRLTVTDQLGERQRTVMVPSDQTVENLLQVLPARLEYPVTDDNGQPIPYLLYRDGTVLPMDQTLDAFGVEENDVLSLSSEPMAGAL